MGSVREEEELYEDFLKEAEEDVIEEQKHPVSGKKQGVLGILVGLVGLFMPVGFQLVFAATGAILAVFAHKHGASKLAIPAALLAIFNFVGLAFASATIFLN